MTAFGCTRSTRWSTLAACWVAAITLGGCAVASRSPLASVTPSAHPNLPSGQLDAGTYTIPRLHGESIDIQFTVPDGWEGLGGVVVLKHDVGLGFWVVDNLYVDPCHESRGVLDPPPGPTVQDLAAALAAQPLRNGSDPTPIEIDGYAGEMVTIHVPVDADLAVCDDQEYGSWTGHGARGHATPGERDEVMIVDVDGVRLVIDASTFPDSSAEDLAELRLVIDSIQLAPGA